MFQDLTRLNPLMTVGSHLLDTLKAHRPDSDNWRQQRRDELLERGHWRPASTPFPTS